MTSTDAKPVTLNLGPRQANVVISALTELAISLGADVRCGDAGAILEQQVAMNLRDNIARQLRRAGHKANW